MIKVKKDNVIMGARDKNQASAFTNNGWTIIGEDEQTSKAEPDFSEYMNAPEESEDTKYTKSAILRLSTAELKELAISENIPEAEEKTGADLKKELIEHFNL